MPGEVHIAGHHCIKKPPKQGTAACRMQAPAEQHSQSISYEGSSQGSLHSHKSAKHERGRHQGRHLLIVSDRCNATLVSHARAPLCACALLFLTATPLGIHLSVIGKEVIGKEVFLRFLGLEEVGLLWHLLLGCAAAMQWSDLWTPSAR